MSDLMKRLGDLGGPDEAPTADVRERALARLREPSVRRRRSRRRLALGGLLAAATFAAAGAGWAALSGGGGSSTASEGVACLSEASLRPQTTAQISFDGRSAVAICAGLWRKGYIVRGRRKAPPLQACVARTGGGPVRVMPGADGGTCTRLGLVAKPGAGTVPRERRYAAFQRDVIRSVHHRRGCILPREGERIVRATIAEHGMTGWRTEEGGGIRGEGFSDARPCVSLSFDSRRRVVVLVPMVR